MFLGGRRIVMLFSEADYTWAANVIQPHRGRFQGILCSGSETQPPQSKTVGSLANSACITRWNKPHCSTNEELSGNNSYYPTPLNNCE